MQCSLLRRIFCFRRLGDSGQQSYLRLAKRVRPAAAVGIKFGQKGYVLTIHKSVEDDVHRNPRMRASYP